MNYRNKFLQALANGHNLRQMGNNVFTACCPAHQDSTPSLSIRILPDKILFHCFAGCEPEDILKSLNLKWEDVFSKDNNIEISPFDILSEEHKQHLLNRGLVEQQIELAGYKTHTQTNSIAIPLRNPKGELYDENAYLLRMFTDKKYYLQAKYPYTHFSILGSICPERLVITEGPLKADVTAALSGWKTVGLHGLRVPTKEDISVLRSFDIPIGFAADMDVFSNSSLATNVMSLLTTFIKEGLFVECGIWDEEKGIDDALYRGKEIKWISPQEFICRTQKIFIASNITATTVNWLFDGLLAPGCITLLEGDPGVGKSMFSSYVASKISQTDKVFIIAPEDDPASSIVPRLIKHNALLDNVFIFDNPVDLADNMHRTLLNIIQPKLLIYDPISSCIKDINSENIARNALQGIQKICREMGCACLAIRHLNKSKAKTEYRGLGSIGILAVARIAAVCEREGEVLVIRVFKNNLSGELKIITGIIEDRFNEL